MAKAIVFKGQSLGYSRVRSYYGQGYSIQGPELGIFKGKVVLWLRL